MVGLIDDIFSSDIIFLIQIINLQHCFVAIISASVDDADPIFCLILDACT
jgi:hypothetical protein